MSKKAKIWLASAIGGTVAVAVIVTAVIVYITCFKINTAVFEQKTADDTVITTLKAKGDEVTSIKLEMSRELPSDSKDEDFEDFQDAMTKSAKKDLPKGVKFDIHSKNGKVILTFDCQISAMSRDEQNKILKDFLSSDLQLKRGEHISFHETCKNMTDDKCKRIQ